MYTKENIEEELYKILSSGPRIPYSQVGLSYILDELEKVFPVDEVVFNFQDIEEMTKQDRIERKLPELFVRYK